MRDANPAALLLVEASVRAARIGATMLAREQIVLGRFQRARSAIHADVAVSRGLAITRRASGGPAILAGAGTLHLVLALPRHDALVACKPSQVVNRHVRPLLRGLARVGATAHYFGRDWVSVAHRPAAFIGFAHDARTGATIVEAFVAVSHPFALPRGLDAQPARRADPFLGKAPGTLASITSSSLDAERVMASVLAAYDDAYGALERDARGAMLPDANDDRAAWDATLEEVIGFVGASADPLEVGGDMLASEGLPSALADAVDALGPGAPDCAVRAAIGRVLGTSGAALEGLRDPGSLANVVIAARARRPA